MNIINTSFEIARNQKTNELSDMIFGFCDHGEAKFFEQNNAHRWFFSDISDDVPGKIGPACHDMQKLKLWLTRAIERDCKNVLIHCTGGVSRSAAATLLLLILKNNADIKQSIDELFIINPNASPNEWMTEWIDNDMDLKGNLSRAVDERWIIERQKQDPDIFE